MILWNQRPPSLLKGRIFSIVFLPWGGGYHVAVFGDNRDKRKREKRGNDGKGRGCKNSLKKLDGNVGGGASWNNIAPTVF